MVRLPGYRNGILQVITEIIIRFLNYQKFKEMKKIVFGAMLFLFANMANSQAKYGVEASGIMSTASFNESNASKVNKNLNTGYGAGVYAEIAVSDKLSLKPSVNFMKKGVKLTNRYTEESTSVKQNITTNLNYLEVPVLAIYNIKGNEGKWFIGAGPSAGYGLSGKLKGDVEISDGNNSNKESFSVHAFKKESNNGANFKRFDLGLEAVAGHNINKNLAVQLNYLHGLNNIASSSEFDGNRFKNRNIMMSLKYKI